VRPPPFALALSCCCRCCAAACAAAADAGGGAGGGAALDADAFVPTEEVEEVLETRRC
jgi:hypothetical protein